MLPLPAGKNASSDVGARVYARHCDRDRWSSGRRCRFFVGDDSPRPTTMST